MQGEITKNAKISQQHVLMENHKKKSIKTQQN